MTLVPGSLSVQILSLLRVSSLTFQSTLRAARGLARSNHSGDVALARLLDRGLIVCEYRITDAGRKALQELES